MSGTVGRALPAALVTTLPKTGTAGRALPTALATWGATPRQKLAGSACPLTHGITTTLPAGQAPTHGVTT